MVIDYKYVFGTFEECDVDERVTDNLRKCIEDNGLMDEIIMYAVEDMRDWLDWTAGDAFWDALDAAVTKVTGKSLCDWEEEGEDE